MSLTDVREDRLVVSLPEDRYFRLEKSETYAKVKAHALTEVDFGWVKDGGDGLWLMELKDYGGNRPSIASAGQKLRNRLPKNIAHAVLLVSSTWAETPFGLNLRQDLEDTFPDFPDEAMPIRAVAVINVGTVDPSSFWALTTALRSALSAFDLEMVAALPASSNRLEEELGIEIQYDPPE